MGFLKSLLGRFFGPPDRDRFARIVAEALREASETNPHTYDRDGFRLVYTENGKEARVVNLANLHLEYCAAPRKLRGEWLARTVRAMARPMEIPDEFEDVRPDLMPTVRPRSLVEYMRAKSMIDGNEPAEMAWTPLTDHLVACLVYDLPNSMQFVLQEQVEKWGVSLYEAMEVARQNLAEREFAALGLEEKLYVVETGDSYDATRMLLTDRVRQMPVAGRHVAMPVTRNTLLVTGEDDPDGLGLMAHIAVEKAGDARPLCPIPAVLDGDEWRTWQPPAGHPHHDAFRTLRLQFEGGEYADQKELLEQLNTQAGRDVFVASYSAVERDGVTRTWAIWSRGVSTLLPRTEFVALFDPETKWTRFVRWERLEEIAGHRLTPEECYPPRWLVTDFPTPEEIERMDPEDWKKP